jgi:hypothetical protein
LNPVYTLNVIFILSFHLHVYAITKGKLKTIVLGNEKGEFSGGGRTVSCNVTEKRGAGKRVFSWEFWSAKCKGGGLEGWKYPLW